MGCEGLDEKEFAAYTYLARCKEIVIMVLYVCGNGFDLHHGLKTSYCHYRDFLARENADLLKKLRNLLEQAQCPLFSEDAFWSNVEDGLTLSYETVMSEIVEDNYPDPDAEFDESDLIQEQESELFMFLREFTTTCFYSWLTSMDFAHCVKSGKVNISEDSKIITFNYTDVLECIYGIDEKRVFHVHGRLRDVKNKMNQMPASEREKFLNENILFGSSRVSPSGVYRELQRQYERDEYYYTAIAPAIYDLETDIIFATKKIANARRKMEFFIGDIHIEEVHIMGVSMGNDDMEYFQEVIIPKTRDSKWIFMYHSQDDQKRYEAISKQYGIINAHYEYW